MSSINSHKRITPSTLQNCRVDLMAVQVLHNIPNGEHLVTIINKLVDDLFSYQDYTDSNNNIRLQLIINTLSQYNVIVYIDDTNIPCDNATELFDEDIRQLERTNAGTTEEAECGDEGEIYDFFNDDDCDDALDFFDDDDDCNCDDIPF